MKTLITTLVALTLSFTTLPAKDGTFSSVVIGENDKVFRVNLSTKQWMKITNFIQNDVGETPAERAGVAVFQGDAALWVLFADGPSTTRVAHEDLFIGGPAIVTVPPMPGATVFLTYQRGSD
jgi:hypothetical protein